MGVANNVVDGAIFAWCYICGTVVGQDGNQLYKGISACIATRSSPTDLFFTFRVDGPGQDGEMNVVK